MCISHEQYRFIWSGLIVRFTFFYGVGMEVGRMTEVIDTQVSSTLGTLIRVKCADAGETGCIVFTIFLS